MLIKTVIWAIAESQVEKKNHFLFPLSVMILVQFLVMKPQEKNMSFQIGS